jgi:hypothetical protein
MLPQWSGSTDTGKWRVMMAKAPQTSRFANELPQATNFRFDLEKEQASWRAKGRKNWR